MLPRLRLSKLALAALLLFAPGGARADFDRALLERRLNAVVSQLGGARLGAGLMDLSDRRTWFFNGDRRFPMQSVYKAPIGAAVFRLIEEGKLSLDQRITLRREDLSVPFSAIARGFAGPRDYSIRELLEAMLGTSDNTASDVLMRLAGGPRAVTKILREGGIEGMRVDRYERDLQPEAAGLGVFRPEWTNLNALLAAVRKLPDPVRRQALEAYLADPRDTSTPAAAVDFLAKIESGELLPRVGRQLLDMMAAATTGPNRIKAGVPAGSAVAHKTGTSADVLGVNAATNDVGVVTLPDGRRFAIAVFVSGSDKPAAVRGKIIADVARAAAEALR